jgi:crotonobetainyl-CoA:carnitine CoA-transferase CaiB-like acyl-CoA transferase
VRVLDLTNVIAGPLASYQMVMLGAEVIKIEVPGVGDLSRKMGFDPQMGEKQYGASFCANNAGKKSITLNLKHARGKELFKRLLKEADVVMENFRPGVMNKLGLGYEVLRALKPSIVYCAVSGFGQEGPLSQRPSYDQIIQGFSGLMSVTGDEKTAPLRSGFVVCDTMAAMTAAFAVCAALFRRERTGEGEMIDVSMLDASLTTMAAWPVTNYLNSGKVPSPMGNENVSASPSGTFRTGEGLLNIVNNEQSQYHRLCDVIGRPDLKTDPRFADRNERIARRYELRPIIEEALQAKGAREWEKLFDEAGVPAGPILSVPDIMAHAHVEFRGLVKRFERVAAVGKDVAVPRTGFRLASGQPDVDRPPPVLGEDTEAVLAGIGCTPEEISELRRDKII